jgi:DNA topoisomerase I
MTSGRALIIVESPAKAKTISGFLGKDFMVESSIGHIRDLASKQQMPAAYQKAPWARFGVNVDEGFKPFYVVDDDKKQQIQKLKDLLSKSDRLFLATDEDREGESIAWHLLEVLKPKVPVKRMVFHEITKPAIQKAIDNPRELDRRLVDAQEARRILDKLYGYEVSPVLWRRIKRGLSAGRVQSVATRIVVDREKTRMRFVRASYWDLEAKLQASEGVFTAAVIAKDGQRLATSRDFDEQGRLTKAALVLDERAARDLAADLDLTALSVLSVERKPTRRTPAPPFMTSTLQQDASRKFRWDAKRSMTCAQRLYEGGFITYMRTDSTQLSTAAVASARASIKEMYGADYLPPEPRVYAKKVKNAQEAHEAIRPAGDVFRHPEEVAREVGEDEARLYELIWMRTIASQMKDSVGESVQARIGGPTKKGSEVELSATGHSIVFPGFLRAYVEGSDDPAAELEGKEKHLPRLTEGEKLPVVEVVPKGHETQPPARFTEASLVQKLEELGVGRPSTYASTISTIKDRGYVWKKGTALVPDFTAFAVVQLMESHFDTLIDYAFTARMEDDLDSIANGREDIVPWLERFYFGQQGKKGSKPKPPADGPGGGSPLEQLGLKALVENKLEAIDPKDVNAFPLGKSDAGEDVVIRVGKWGPFLTCGDQKANIPPGLPPDELTLEKAKELLETPSGNRLLGTDPANDQPVYVKSGRFGPFFQLGDGGKGNEKPKTSSLLPSMDPTSVTLDDALKMLSLPRVVGVDPASKNEVTAQIGQFGAYIKLGTESRSLERKEQVFEVTLSEALAILAQPKARGARRAAQSLKDFPEDVVSKKPIRVMQGRFGLYVTDGNTNATLRSEDSLETLTHERAMVLLQMRRERGDSGPSTKKAPPKKASPKKTSAEKSATEKPAAKKPAAKKPAAKKPAAKKPVAKKPAAKKK